MKAAHGTKNKIDNFKLFDYKIDVMKNSTDSESVSEGLDAYGPGIYFFNNLSDEDLVMNAKRYTINKQDSYIYKVNVDIEDDELLNNIDPSYFDREDLVAMVESYINNERDLSGFNWDGIEEIIYSLEDNFDNIASNDGDVSLLLINKIMSKENISFQLNEYSNPNEFESFDDWKNAVEEQYGLEEPCSYIADEGGPVALVNYCVDRADTAWDVVNNLFMGVAVSISSQYSSSKNKTFQDVMLRELSDYVIKGAQVEDQMLVVFDTDCITIEDELLIKKEKKVKNKLKLN